MTLHEPDAAVRERALEDYRIPAQPQLLLELQRELARPDPSVDTVAELIGQDPGITGPVMKLINSPLFSLPNEITSLNRAVSLLGMAEVVSLATGILLRSNLSEGVVANLTPFWDSSADVAAASALIARELLFELPDQAYLLGLFHNAGIPMLLMRYPDAMVVMHRGYVAGWPDTIEDQTWNCTHPVLGYYLARSWQMPEVVCRATLLHHATEQVFAQADSAQMPGNTMLAILKLAEHICLLHKRVGSSNEDHEWNRIGAQVLDWLEISEQEAEELAEICQHRGIQFASA